VLDGENLGSEASKTWCRISVLREEPESRGAEYSMRSQAKCRKLEIRSAAMLMQSELAEENLRPEVSRF
jgi:hypothetical protein